MQKNVEETLNLLMKAFKAKFNDFRGLYLFGLFTDGKSHSGEDIEVAAVFDVENKIKREEIWPIVGKIESDLDVYIDLHPITMEMLENDDDYFDEVVNNGIYFPLK